MTAPRAPLALSRVAERSLNATEPTPRPGDGRTGGDLSKDQPSPAALEELLADTPAA